MKKNIMFQVLFLMTLGFAFQAQAIQDKALTPHTPAELKAFMDFTRQQDAYKFVNLTDHRTLVRYDRDIPFLQKGYEVKPGECLYIHTDDFSHLSIFLLIEGTTQTLCNFNGNTVCQPVDYTLTYPPSVTEKEAPIPTGDSSVVKELSYIETGQTSETENTPAIHWVKTHDFVLMKKRTDNPEECDLF